MRVSVLDTWEALYEGNAQEVLLPGDDGELGILDFHHPMLCRLRQGVIQILRRAQPPGGRGRGRAQIDARIPIRDGIARMAGNELTVLVER